MKHPPGTVTDWQEILTNLPKEPTLLFMVVTPDCAKALKGLNGENRKVNRQTVIAYKASMKAGHWKINGQCVEISTTGRLLNGQHRMEAVIESGATVVLPFCFGIPESTISTYDVGQRRTLPQQLHLTSKNGDPTKALRASAVSYVNHMSHILIGEFTKFPYVEDWRPWWEELRPDVEWAIDSFTTTELPGFNNSCVAAPLALGHRLHPEETDEFVEKMLDLSFKTDHDPAVALRKVVIKAAQNRGFGGGSRDRAHVVRKVFTAFYAHLLGKPLSILKDKVGSKKDSEGNVYANKYNWTGQDYVVEQLLKQEPALKKLVKRWTDEAPPDATEVA